MTSFQRMVLIAAALFMITAQVTDAQCGCFPSEDCGGRPQEEVSVTTQSISHVLYIVGLFHGLKFSFKKYLLECIFVFNKIIYVKFRFDANKI